MLKAPPPHRHPRKKQFENTILFTYNYLNIRQMARILYSKIIEKTVIVYDIVTQFIFFNRGVNYLAKTNEKPKFLYD